MKHELKNEILFVSSYPPRECGIATYTQDLINAVKVKFGRSLSLKVCALENKPTQGNYGEEVKYILDTSNNANYITIAEKINKDEDTKVVFIQHEFGLFSGEYGDDILYFLYSVHKPVLISFHTVLPEPDNKRRNLVNAMINLSESVVVMTENSKKILVTEYNIEAEKISVIHHGTHLSGCSDKNDLKLKFNLRGKYVLSTFGLLSSGKSIETAVDALPAIINQFPNVVYLIIGRTHPEIIRQEGEIYRAFLESKVRENGLTDHVRFVNKYLSLENLLEYLQLTDIYLFTSKSQHQAVSGTFSYAMSCSCPVISTPIPHAKEMLNNGAGKIFDFLSSEQLAGAVIELLSNPIKRKEMSLKALQKICPTSWPNSALAHSRLFQKSIKPKLTLEYSLPEISLSHIKRLTTETGITQFSYIHKPDPDSGYTLDDNARALIAVIKHYELTDDSSDIKLIDIYLNFIKFAQQPEGNFLNYVDKYGSYHEKNKYVNLEDSMGRAIWALGELILHRNLFTDNLIKTAEEILIRALPNIIKLSSPRAVSFAIKGLYLFNLVKKSDGVNFIIKELADNLVVKYQNLCDSDWKWYEEYLTYANSVIPEAMLYAYLEAGNMLYKTTAIDSFNFLLSKIFTDKNIRVISNRGWHSKGQHKNSFGEQPIDVAYTILALDLFYSVFGSFDYRQKMDIAFSWFLGNNHLNQIIYNPATAGCHDGLEEYNVNLNQGAESSVCYMIARLTIEKYIGKQEEITEKSLYAQSHHEFAKEN